MTSRGSSDFVPKVALQPHTADFVLFGCLGLRSLLNIWGYIATVPACSSGTLTNVLLHRNAMPQTQDMTPHPVTVYRHRTDLTYYPSMWNITLEYTTTHFNVLGQIRSGNHSQTFHTHQRTLTADFVPRVPCSPSAVEQSSPVIDTVRL